MNILHITSAKSWRGGERQILFLLEGLQKRGHTVYLMSPDGSEIGKRSTNLIAGSTSFARGIQNLLSNILRLNRICAKNKIDLIHGHDSHAHTLIWLSYRYGRLNVKSVISRRLISKIKPKSITKYNDNRIQKILCVSGAVKKALSSEIIHQERLSTVYSGIDLSNAEVEVKSLNPPFTVGYVAAFEEEKDHDTFIRAAKIILSRRKDVNFLLVGGGSLLEEIKAKIKGIESHFVFTGIVTDVEIEYKKMDLLLHTCRLEALGTSILDGMKFGLPIVSTNTGGIPEVVEDDVNGYLHDAQDAKGMADSICKLLDSNDLYYDFSKASSILVKKFDKERMIENTITEYMNLL